MATLAVMKARIADELNRSDLTSQIALAITSAIDHYKYERFWFNEGTATDATVDGTEYYAAPSSPTQMISVDSIRLNDGSNDYVLEPRNFAYVESLASQSVSEGPPFCWAPYKDRYRFWPIPDDAYDTTWAGVIELAALSSDSSTNAWTTEAEELIRQRAKNILRLDVIMLPAAVAEAQSMLMRGSTALSILEDSALRKVRRMNVTRLGTGRIAPGV